MLNSRLHIAISIVTALIVITLCALNLEPIVVVGIGLVLLAFHPAIP